MKKVISFLMLIMLISCGEDSRKEEVAGESKIKVASVNYPLHYFAQRIGGDRIEAVYPVSPDGDPAYWQPEAEAIAVYQSADVILLNGADYAKWTQKVSLPASKMVNTSKAISQNYIELNEGTTHSHGPEGEHEHLGYAFTTWLNFKNAVKQAESVKESLTKTLPASKEYFERNFDELKKDLDKFDADMTELSKRLIGKTLFASHPVYQYLAKEYHLNILSEHWEPDQVPSEDQYAAFKKKLKINPSTIMLWEDKPMQEVEKRLNDLGVKVCVFNPCGNKPAEGDFISVMKKNISNLAAVIK